MKKGVRGNILFNTSFKHKHLDLIFHLTTHYVIKDRNIVKKLATEEKTEIATEERIFTSAKKGTRVFENGTNSSENKTRFGIGK